MWNVRADGAAPGSPEGRPDPNAGHTHVNTLAAFEIDND